MNKNTKEYINALLVAAAIVLSFIAFSSSLLLENGYSYYLGRFSNEVNLLLRLFIIIISASIVLINVYAYSVMKWLRNMLYSVVFFMYSLIGAMEILAFDNVNIFKSNLDILTFRLFLGISFMVLLIVLFIATFINPRYKISESFTGRSYIVPMLFGASALFVGLYFILDSQKDSLSLVEHIENARYAISGIYVLLVVASVFRLYRDNSAIGRNIVYTVSIFCHTYVLMSFYKEGTNFEDFMVYTYRAIVLFSLAVAFYRTLFTGSFLSMVSESKQKELYAENLEQLVEERTLVLSDTNKKLQSEVESAKQLQQSILPPREITFGRVSFISEYLPCEKLSGDFYDIYQIDDDRVGMYVLDVSGHGISAALMNVYCYNYIRSTNPLIKRYLGDKPHRNLSHLYEEFNRMHFPDEMHLVMFIASYDTRANTLAYSSGGLNVSPILVRKNGDIEYLDKSRGFPICKLGEFYTPEYTHTKVQLSKGDRVLFYTDGLTAESHRNIIGTNDIIEIMVRNISRTLRDIKREITDRISLIDELDDDITYFIMEVE